MKGAVSYFEKLLVSLIIFIFCIVVLVQIFINNDVLDTIKSNESGTPVSLEESYNYLLEGKITLSTTDINNTKLLINGEEALLDNAIKEDLIEINVRDGDVIEIKNNMQKNININIVEISEEITLPKINDNYECKKGITYLFKVQTKKS
ncbi:MAG: hypothetical protein ACOWWH_05780 [Eubacteriaceae bacterium]